MLCRSWRSCSCCSSVIGHVWHFLICSVALRCFDENNNLQRQQMSSHMQFIYGRANITEHSGKYSDSLTLELKQLTASRATGSLKWCFCRVTVVLGETLYICLFWNVLKAFHKCRDRVAKSNIQIFLTKYLDFLVIICNLNYIPGLIESLTSTSTSYSTPWPCACLSVLVQVCVWMLNNFLMCY